jgi:hypothetical protein
VRSIAPDLRSIVITAAEVEATRVRLVALAGAWAWDEAIRRCNGWPLSLRDACWLVTAEWLEGSPRCWLPVR